MISHPTTFFFFQEFLKCSQYPSPEHRHFLVVAAQGIWPERADPGSKVSSSHRVARGQAWAMEMAQKEEIFGL